MENQHRKISGYRELTQEDINNMNGIKELGVMLGNMIERLERDPDTDKRWLAIGKTDLQKGIMSVVRSIAKPSVF